MTAYTLTATVTDTVNHASGTGSAQFTVNQPVSSFMTKSGTKLMLGGSPWKGIGFDCGMVGSCWSGTNWSTSQMNTYFSGLPAHGLTRVFIPANAGLAFVQSIVAAATTYNQKLILVLGDDDSNCNDTDGAPNGAGSGKTLAFYQSGWQGAYSSWVNTVVPALKTSTAIAMWEIANEPFQGGATYPTVSLSVMQSYLNGCASLIKSLDPNHLVTVGLVDTGNQGGQANTQTVLSGPNIDVVQYHDYSYDYEGGALISSNFAQFVSIATNLGKAFVIGEAGYNAGGSGPTYAQRVTYLTSKANYALASANGNCSGFCIWDYETMTYSTPAYEIIPPSDPMIAAVKNYVMPA